MFLKLRHYSFWVMLLPRVCLATKRKSCTVTTRHVESVYLSFLAFAGLLSHTLLLHVCAFCPTAAVFCLSPLFVLQAMVSIMLAVGRLPPTARND